MKPIYEKFAQKMSVVSNMKVYKIEATKNEVEGIEIENVPTVYIYTHGAKRKRYLNRDGFRMLELMDFIKRRSDAYREHYGIAEIEEEE